MSDQSVETNTEITRIEEAMNSMRRAVAGARDRLGEGLQLTKTQLEILMILAGSSQSTSDLARQLFLTTSAVTQTTDTLVRRDLVERRTDESDRRIIRLGLTAEGRELTDKLRSLRRQKMDALLRKLTPAEVDAFIAITSKLTEVLDEAKTNPKG